MRLARRRFVELGQMVLIATALTQPVAAQSAAAQGGVAAHRRCGRHAATPHGRNIRERFKDRVTRVTLPTHGRDEVFEAAPLLALLEAAAVRPPSGRKNAEVGLPVVARAADGYTVVFGYGELLAYTGAKEVWVATARADGPRPDDQGPVRLLVSSDKRGARSAFGVVEIEVRDLGQPMSPR